ncbi:MAG: DNA mismatch repair protein MutS, partial [Flavobacteriales bacterium]|nr:DNA mismatch repair protein MutS [Flavobacteriales bacterium]
MKPTTDAQTLIDLEFDKILEWCAGFALSDRTKQKILNTSPLSDFDQLQESLSQLQDLKRIKDAERGFPSLEFEELDQELRLLKIKNAVVPLSGILKIHQASFLVNSIIEFFEEHAEQSYGDLEKVLANTYKTMDIIVPIEKVIDPSGQIKDSASTELKSIRDDIRSTQRQIKRNFDKELRKLSKTNLLSDTKETVINNRRVFSIKSSYKKQFPGLVLGSSKTGNVAHIEPEVNMALNVELDHLFIDEEKEIYKILRDLTKEMAAHDWLIRAYNKVLHDLDLIHAKHRLSIAMKAVKPNLIKERVID